MPLADLNKNIYGNNAGDAEKRMHGQSEFDPFENKNGQPSPFQGEEKWGKANKGMTPKQKKILWSIFGVVLFILLAIGGSILYQRYQKDAFHQDRVEISFEGPKTADSTQTVQYKIHYKNNNRVTLKNAEIMLDYSENFQPTDNVNLKYLSSTNSKFFVGDIKPNADATVELTGVFYAPKDFPVYLHATLSYTPTTGAQQLETKNQLAVNITNSPVLLELTAPDQIADGDRVEYVVDYKNLDVRPLKDVQIRIEFPDGFKFTSSSPTASEGQIAWYLGVLEANQGGQIRIQGTMTGSDGQGRPIKVTLGRMGTDAQFAVFNQREKNSRIIAPMLSITQALDDPTISVVKAGDELRYIVKYQNTSNISLRDVIITLEIKGRVLDFSKLKLASGAFDSAKNVIVWKASDIPGLASMEPKAGGEIRFSVPVFNVIPVDNQNSRNYVIQTLAKIDSPDIPTPIGSNKIIGSNALELKVATKVVLETTGFYYDGQLQNSGPLPMEVGKDTTFTLHMGIVNTTNDISNVKVVTALPTGVKWIGKTNPANSTHITYNERTNQIIWDAGDVAAGAGIIGPKREIAFQVSVNPQPSQAGTPIMLLNEAVLTAKDNFTQENIQTQIKLKNTQLREDTKMTAFQYDVAKVAQ